MEPNGNDKSAVVGHRLWASAVEINVPPTWLIAARTRLLDCFHPRLEEIRLPPVTEGPEDVFVDLHAGVRLPSRVPRHPLRRLERRRELVVNDAVIVDSRDWTSFNISHLFLHAITPYLLVRRSLREAGLSDDVVLVIESPMPAYAEPMLTMLGVRWLATDRAVRGQIATVTYGHRVKLRPLVLELLPRVNGLEGGADRVYVSRRNRRCVTNETEVTSFLSARGFRVVYLEDLPLIEQWRAIASAEQVVGVHGAGLINLLARHLHRPGERTTVVEVFGPGYVVEPYRLLSAALAFPYAATRGVVTPDIVRDLDGRGQSLRHQMTDITVDLGALERAMELVELDVAPRDA